MGLAVGIDLGTTNSAIALADKHGTPSLIPNREGCLITPSVICFRDGEILVGDVAKEMQALGAWPVAAFFKRQMGDALFLFNVGDKDYSATELSTFILRKLKDDAEAHLNETITHAVITVPAYFREAERKATIVAGEAAGLTVLQVINEPTAAAVAYGLNYEGKKRKLLVYDLGGGTFDITLIELIKGEVKVLTSDGDHQLGGKDWDDRIIEFLAGEFQDEFGINPLEDTESLADLLIQAEEAKKKLTSFNTAPITIVHDGCRGRYSIDRAKFKELTSDLMERTVSLTERVLAEKKLKPKNIQGILLVGGSTRMPMVSQFIEETFGSPPMTGVNVDEAVALGAAIVAREHIADQKKALPLLGLSGSIKTTDVTNHSLGMIAVNADHSAYVNSIILPKNTEIPCKESRPYQHFTHRGGDNQIEVFITQGEVESPSQVVYIGKYIIHDIPHQASRITVVNITYHYDRSGTVEVAASVKDTNKVLKVSAENLPHDIPDRFLVPPEPIKTEVFEHVTAYLAFDLSGSMQGAPLSEAKKAAIGFLNNVDLSHCSIGVIAFSDTVRTKLKASQNAKSIKRAINELQACETGVCNDAHPFDEILLLLKGVKGRRFAITLADGAWSKQNLAIERAKICHKAEIDIIAIGFGGADQRFLDAIASSDEASFFTSQSGLVETFSTIAQVLTDTGGGILEADSTGKSASGKRLGFLSGIKRTLSR